MIYAIRIDSTNRIEHATFAKYVTPANVDKYILVDAIPTGETEREQDITNYLYIDKKYVYDPRPEPEQPEPTPTPEERIAELEAENKTLTAQVDALSFQLDFQEECLVEMAGIIYA